MKARVLLLCLFLFLAACTPTPAVELFASSPQATVLGARAIISGRVMPGVQVQVNGRDAAVKGGAYAATVDLAWGSNPVIVTAERDGQQQSRTLFVERYAAEQDQVGEMYLRLISVEQAETLGEPPLDEMPSGVFVIVTLEVENRSAGTARMPTPGGFKLEDAGSRLYAMSERGAFARRWDTEPGYLPGREVAAGQTIRGWVVFDASATATDFTLHARGNPEQNEWYARVAVTITDEE